MSWQLLQAVMDEARKRKKGATAAGVSALVLVLAGGQFVTQQQIADLSQRVDAATTQVSAEIDQKLRDISARIETEHQTNNRQDQYDSGLQSELRGLRDLVTNGNQRLERIESLLMNRP